MTESSVKGNLSDEIRIVGLDLALGQTGIAALGNAGVFKPDSTVPMMRLAEFREWAIRLCVNTRPAMCVIEGYAFGAKNGREVTGELHGTVKLALYDHQVPFAIVQPTVLKKFATGVGNAGKDQMVYEAARLGCPASNNNAVDAWWLQQMAFHKFDLPGKVSLPKAQSILVNKVEWPMRFASPGATSPKDHP